MKKSQISIFVILGLIIFLTAVILIYVSNIRLVFQPSKIIPQDVEPIKSLIEQCIEDEARPLIEHMMTHSGYADLTQFTAADYFLDMRVPFDLPKNREEMETSLKNKIEIKLKACIDFAEFKQFDFIEKPSKLTVKINDEDITLALEYPLEITNKKDNTKTRLLNFKKIIPTKLGKLSDLARQIMNQENLGVYFSYIDTDGNKQEKNINFLEEMTLDILRSNMAVFPYEGMEFTTDNKQWSIKNDLKPALKQRLFANLDCITYKGTASETLPASCQDPAKKSDTSLYYQKFAIPVTTDLKYKNTTVITLQTFSPDWNFIDFSVSPSKGDIVKPLSSLKSFNPISSIIASAFKSYHHLYNIQYPVLFTLIDGNDIFNFAVKVSIKNNRPDREAKFFFTIQAVSSDDFCEKKDIEYTVKVQDEQTSEYLRDANIEYQCVQFICDIGKTKPELIPGSNIEKYGSAPGLTAKFPFCKNGILTAKKDGYLDSNIVVENPGLIIVKLTPLTKLNYEFVVQDGLASRKLEDDESILIMLSNEEKNYETQATSESENLELLLGEHTYDATIILTKNDMIIGGYRNEQLNLNVNKDYKKITFYILANSGIQTEEDSAKFWQDTIEVNSKNNNPVLTW